MQCNPIRHQCRFRALAQPRVELIRITNDLRLLSSGQTLARGDRSARAAAGLIDYAGKKSPTP